MQNRKILFLDDEVNLLKSLGRVLERFNFEPTLCHTPDEALRLLSQQSFAVVVSDYRMPQMVGTAFLSLVKERQPHALRILLTGYADVGAAMNAVNESHVFKYLTKPWDEAVIKQTLEDACQQFHLIEENTRLQAQLKHAAIQLRQMNKTLEKKVEERMSEIKKLNKHLESNFLGSIKLMGTVAHTNDPAAAEHAKRVASLCVELGKELGWTGRDLLELQVAGYLHNIAKTSDEAYRLMKMIPDLGQAYDYVKLYASPAKKLDQSAPIGARILAIANAYDHGLHFDHASEAATPTKVLYQLKTQCPDSYDPELVAAFQKCLERLGKLKDDDYETTVNLIGLIPGMVLSRDLCTKSGRMLLQKDNKITNDYLIRILKRHEEDPIDDLIFVYRNSISSISRRGL